MRASNKSSQGSETVTADDFERRRRFFYAEADAGLYDVSISWVVPQYNLLHTALSQAIKRALTAVGSGPIGVIDIGAGSGADTLHVLSRYPAAHVVAVDLCRPMLDRLEDQLASIDGVGTRDRCAVVQADALGEEGQPRALLAHLPKSIRERGAHAVISSLTVHHFEHAEKTAWFRRAFEMLAPGGFLILADLFSFVDPSLSKQWLGYDIDWMRKHFIHQPMENSPLSLAERRRLLRAWIEHYERDNRLEPIESSQASIGQAEMMAKAGFENVATHYRFSLSGILIAQRPKMPLPASSDSFR